MRVCAGSHPDVDGGKARHATLTQNVPGCDLGRAGRGCLKTYIAFSKLHNHRSASRQPGRFEDRLQHAIRDPERSSRELSSCISRLPG
jgi:hypothetical protein